MEMPSMPKKPNVSRKKKKENRTSRKKEEKNVCFLQVDDKFFSFIY